MKTVAGRSIMNMIQTRIQQNGRRRNMNDIWEVNMQWWEQLKRGAEKKFFFSKYIIIMPI